MSHTSGESPEAHNHRATPPLPLRVSEHEFSDIPMITVSKKPIDWSQPPLDHTSVPTFPNHQSAPDETANESETVVLDDANSIDNEEEIDAVAQVLEDWNPMAEDHFKEKRKLQQITPEKNNLLTVHFENIPLSITKESFTNMLRRAGAAKNVFMAKHKQKEANFANASFATHQEYDRAFQEFNNFTVEGNKIRLSPGKPTGAVLTQIPLPSSSVRQSMSFTNSTQEVENLKDSKTFPNSNMTDEFPPLPPSPDAQNDTIPKLAPVFIAPPSLVPISAQLHLLANGPSHPSHPTSGAPRMPWLSTHPPVSYPPAPKPNPQQVQETETPDNTLCCDGPLKIAEHSDDEGFDVSLDVDSAMLDKITSSIMAIPPSPDNTLQPNLDGTPTVSTSHPPRGSNSPQPFTHKSPTPVHGYTNGIDSLEPNSSFSSEVNIANLAGRYMFTDNINLNDLPREFPFMVTHTSDFVNVFGILGFHDDVQQFNAMQAEMKEICDKAKQPIPVDSLVKNTIYIYIDAQGDTYRALYINNKVSTSVLLLIDIGKYLSSGEEFLYHITPHLSELPYLHIKLRLNDLRNVRSLSKDEMQEICKKFIHTFQVYTARKNGRDKQGYLYIDLIEQTTNMNANKKIIDYIINNFNITADTFPKNPSSNPSHFHFPPATPNPPKEGTFFCRDIPYHQPPHYHTCNITALNIISPTLFYAVEYHPEAQSKFSNLQKDLNKTANSLSPVSRPELGMFVAAYRYLTSLWCRAEIVQIVSETICAVFYIDFGCHEAVSVDDLRIPSQIFATLPKQALTFSLDSVRSLNPTGEWDEVATDMIKSHCHSHERRMVRIVNKIGNIFFVSLFEDESCLKTINEKLIERGLCTSQPQIPVSLTSPLSAPVPPVEPSPPQANEPRPSTAQPDNNQRPQRFPQSQSTVPMQEAPLPAFPDEKNREEIKQNLESERNRYRQFSEQNRREHPPHQEFHQNQDSQGQNNQFRDRQNFQGQRNNYNRPNKHNQNSDWHNRNNDRQGHHLSDNNRGGFNNKYSQNRSQNRGFNRNLNQEFKNSTQLKPYPEKSPSQTSNTSKASGKPRISASDTFAPHSSIPFFLASNLGDFCPAFENAKKDRIPIEITHIVNPNDFWVIPMTEKERFRSFVHKLRGASESQRGSNTFNPELGRMCLYWDDHDELNRAELTAVNQDDTVSIFLIDMGVMIDTSLSNLQPAPYAILDYSTPLALNCSLANLRPKAGGWSNGETEIFKSLAYGRVLQMSTNDLKHVDLWDPSDLESPHVNAQFDSVRNRTLTTPVPFDSLSQIQYCPNVFPTNGQIQVMVTDFLTNKVIRVQITKDVVNQMHVIDSKLKSSEFNFVDQLKPGLPCVAQYSEDSQWYRAKVLTVQESGLIVEFVDFGNNEEKDTNQIRALPIELLETPPLAHNCLIYQASEYGDNWSVETRQKLGQLINGAATAVWRGETNRMPIIELFKGDCGKLSSITQDLQNIVFSSQQIIPSNSTVSSPKRSFFSDLKPQALQIGRLYPSIIFSCANPHDIWIIRTSDVEELGKLSENMTIHSVQTPSIPQFIPSIQEICRYHSTADNKMYRCLVEAVDEEKIHAYVNLFDMVDTRWVALASIQPLDPTFLTLPPLAFHCKLANTVPIETNWPPTIQEELLSLLKEKDFSVVAKEKVEGLFIVDISSDMMISLIEDLNFRGLARCTEITYLNATNLATQSLPMTKDYFQVFILEVVSPSLFFVSLIDKTVQQNQMSMMASLAAFPAKAEKITFKPFIGMLCASLYKDNSWYRVKVTAINTSSITVCYIDFGNYDQTVMDKLAPLTDPAFLKFPTQAIQCRLGNIQHPEWSHQTINRFRELIFNKSIHAKILEMDGSLYTLELVDTSLVQDVNIADELIRTNLASSLHQILNPPTQPITMNIQVQPVPNMQQHNMPHQPPRLPTQPIPNVPQYGSAPLIPKPPVSSIRQQTAIPQIPLAVPSMTNPPLHPMPTQAPNIPPLSTLPSLPAMSMPQHTTAPSIPTQQHSFSVPTLPNTQHYPPPPRAPNPGVPPILTTLPTRSQIVPPTYPPPPSNPIPLPSRQLPLPNLPTTAVFQCVICWVASPVEVTIQWKDEVIIQGLKRLDDVISTQIQYTPPLTTCEVGAYCLACFREDKVWYRACITKVNGTAIEVKFLDFGNIEEQVLVELRRMPPELLDIPPLCYNVKLAGVAPSSHKSASECIQYLKGFSASCTSLTGEIIDKATDTIELYLDGANIIDNLILSASFTISTPPFPLQTLPTDSYFRAMVIEPKDPGDFYLNCGEREQELSLLLQEIRDYCVRTPQDAFPLIRGTICLALYSADNNWYRAKIIGIPNREHLMVQFIDYGNKEMVPRANIRNPPSQFLALPAQSMHCSLFQGDPPPNVHELKDKFMLAVSNKMVFARSLGVGVENRCYIELLSEHHQKILDSLYQYH